jgi:hypothetical protein
METSGLRHQGFMSHGPPSHHLPMMAMVIKERLEQKHRCLYFDSEQMVAGLLSHLARVGVDVAREISQNSLVVYCHLGHLSEDQTFDTDRMIATLEVALTQTLRDGYVGLWSSGDIAWEFGPRVDYGQLAQYEMKLDEFMRAHSEMSAICQYHSSVLPPVVMQTGHQTHPSLFINEAHSELNPAYEANNRIISSTSHEDLCDLSFPQDIRARASACADSMGITLNEFIKRSISEKLNSNRRKSFWN